MRNYLKCWHPKLINLIELFVFGSVRMRKVNSIKHNKVKPKAYLNKKKKKKNLYKRKFFWFSQRNRKAVSCEKLLIS